MRAVALLLVSVTLTSAQFNHHFLGVAFSPYTKAWSGNQAPRWNSYNLQDVFNQMWLISSKFSSISSYSTGLNQWNMNNAWDELDSNCLVGKAAAFVNQHSKSRIMRVNLGIYQHEDSSMQDKEISFALEQAKKSNEIYGNTVWGLTFTNEYIVDERTGRRVLDMIRSAKRDARSSGLKLGVRIHTCGQINNQGPLRDQLVAIARESDFIFCNFYPSEHVVNNVYNSVQEVARQYVEAKNGFKNVNPNIDVQIGETGWPSAGINFNKSPNSVANLREYWRHMNDWASQNSVSVQMFSAIDEPWKCDKNSQDVNAFNGPNGGECHFGLWYREGDRYIEKQ